MADSVAFELVSPEKLLISEAVDMVVVPGTDGNFGVLPRHAPMISTVRPGVMDIYKGGRVSERIFVAGGFAEVMPDRCTVLADVAVPVSELDTAKAEHALKDAREDLADAKTDADRQAAEKAIAVAEAMIAAAGR
jgi:F-type H+-transporting ATPase subunit epsilon